MDSSPSPSPSPSATETITANLRMIWRGLRAAMGAWRIEPVIALVAYSRISATFRRIERMLVRFRAGKLWRVTRRDAAPRQKAREQQQQAAVRLPRKFGWLVLAGKHHAACFGSQLQTVLTTPEMTELLESSEQARRVLRPLCRALAVELPWVIDQPRAERKPRVRKPRPKPEPFRIPLPRGALTRARKYKALDEAIKLRDELVLKMAKTRPV